MNIGKRIKDLRQLHNLSSKELAKKINSSQPVVSKLENNLRIPDVPTIEKICSIFDISLVEFFDDNIQLKHMYLLSKIKKLSKDDLKLVENIIDRLIK